MESGDRLVALAAIDVDNAGVGMMAKTRRSKITVAEIAKAMGQTEGHISALFGTGQLTVGRVLREFEIRQRLGSKARKWKRVRMWNRRALSFLKFIDYTGIEFFCDDVFNTWVQLQWFCGDILGAARAVSRKRINARHRRMGIIK